MGDIGKPIRKITLVPMPDDVPVPEIIPEPVEEPVREPVKVPVPA